ncbi:hypothetical protein M0R45_025109 [Rubus argutus]|uniref:Uncharacterized protein n=1 Tax=Rubus argutus TaxID=59490 RepID=A0AAW1WT53_RUBAR
MNDKTQSHNSSMSLVSRLDHLDFLMKYLERKQTLAKLEGNNGSSSAGEVLKKKKQCMPMDLALKETYFKGSLMDRVAALENRLFQLCLENESRSSSSTSTRASSGDTYWSHGSKGESSCSLPTFTTKIPFQSHNKRPSQVHATRLEIEEQPDREEPEQKPSSSPAQQKLRKKKTTRANKDEKSHKTEKKRIPPFSWPQLKILGC